MMNMGARGPREPLTLPHGIRRAAVLAGLLATFLALTQASSAGAWSSTHLGTTGYVQVPYAYGGNDTYGSGPYLHFPKRLVRRASGYSSTETIYLRYRIYQANPTVYNHQWYLLRDRTIHSYVQPGYYLTFGTWRPSVTATEASYRVTVKVTWARSSNNSFLGSTFINYNGYDYQCLSSASYCQTGRGFITIGF